MIEVKNLYKSYGDKGVLSDINFAVSHGQSVAIVGKSGAGKSVLLKCLIGLVKPDEGTIYIENKLINSMNFQQLQKIRSKIGMVFQFGALFDSMTVEENISLALHKLTKLNENEIQQRVKNSLDKVGMADTGELMPAELSGGMKKRVGIARAIAIKPAYLFYDEPTTGLDPVMTDSINRLIRKFQNTGEVTSVIITHEMRTVYDVADRVILLHEGIIQYAELVRSAFPDFHNTVEDLIAEGDKVAACLTHRGTHHGEIYNVKPTGRKVHYIGTAIFVFRDGLIGNAWVLSDRLELLQQLGGPEPDDSGLEI